MTYLLLGMCAIYIITMSLPCWDELVKWTLLRGVLPSSQWWFSFTDLNWALMDRGCWSSCSDVNIFVGPSHGPRSGSCRLAYTSTLAPQTRGYLDPKSLEGVLSQPVFWFGCDDCGYRWLMWRRRRLTWLALMRGFLGGSC